MKAAREILTNQRYGFSKEQFESALNAMQEYAEYYARIQIEKDRESIKKDMPDVVKAMINAVPINLD